MNVNGDTYFDWLESDYPRPQLCRDNWMSLDGEWGFSEDSEQIGVSQRWYEVDEWCDQKVVVPYPPNSQLSGVKSDSDVVWYARRFTLSEFAGLSDENFADRVVIRFEGVDYFASVWVNGIFVGQHEGGYVGFSMDITDALVGEEVLLVVRAEDGRSDSAQPRGKQDWRARPHDIWYDGIQGIWRSVWVEVVPSVRLESVNYRNDGSVLEVIPQIVGASVNEHLNLKVTVSRGGVVFARQTAVVTSDNSAISLQLLIDNQFDESELYWSPDNPVLFNVDLELESEFCRDCIKSYAGLREVSVDRGYFLLNQRPCYVKGVLDQGWWDESFFTPPSAAALRADLKLVQQFGFNTVRVHQRSADQRYLAWADYLGILVWSEFPSTFTFSEASVVRTLFQWSEQVKADSPHPSVVVWVPLNESWGVPRLDREEQKNFVRAIVCLTKSLDNTRPVISNDGWEHLMSDIITTHDYAATGEELSVAYETSAAVKKTLEGAGPQGRLVLIDEAWNGSKPVMVSEFGGISLAPDDIPRKESALIGEKSQHESNLTAESWGYLVSADKKSYRDRLKELFDALYDSPVLAGICYTQLADTRQETNGLCYANRTPKISVDEICNIVSANDKAFRLQIRPRVVSQVVTGGNQLCGGDGCGEK